MYSVNDGLQEILARQKSEALQQQQLQRQAMLDELNKKKIESDMATDKENAAAMRTYREGMAENYRAQANQRNVESLDQSGFMPGANVTGKLSPGMLKSGQDAGRINSVPQNPDAWKGNEEDFHSGDFFLGNPVQQRVKGLIESGDITDPSVIMQMQAMAALGDTSMAANMFTPKTQEAFTEGLDGKFRNASGAIVNSLPINARIGQVSREPQGPQGPAPQLVQVPDTENPGQFFQRWAKPGDDEALKPPPPTPPATLPPSGPVAPQADPMQGMRPDASGAMAPAPVTQRQGDIQLNPRPTGGAVSGLPVHRGNVPASVVNKPLPKGATNAQVNSMRAALAQFARAQSGAAGTNPESAQQGLAMAQNQIISTNLQGEQDLQMAVREILSMPDKNTASAEDLIKRVEDRSTPLPPDMREKLYSTLLLVLGRIN